MSVCFSQMFNKYNLNTDFKTNIELIRLLFIQHLYLRHFSLAWNKGGRW